MKVMITGAAGFVGMHVAAKLLARGDQVIGVDSLNGYYDPALKRARLDRLLEQPGFAFERLQVEDTDALSSVFLAEAPQRVIHLAAQVGVRHSVTDPQACSASNLQGFLNVLEACRRGSVEHLLYASSSSVYGGNARLPSSEEQGADHPISLYAATKRANELMAHAYSHLFRIPTTGFRLFTVYGPWGRPDMAMWRFARAILEGSPLEVYNGGRMSRDFTYVDDVVEPIVRLLDKPATPVPGLGRGRPGPGESDAPFRLFNVGGGHPVGLMDVIHALEAAIGRPAQLRPRPMQPGDARATAARTDRLQQWIGPCPVTPLHEGIRRFVDWYVAYHQDTRAHA